MIESLNPDLAAAPRRAPDKTPARRLATLEAAGEAGIPFTTGLLVGIGETSRRPSGSPGGDRIQPSAPRPRPGGDHPELPARSRARRCTVLCTVPDDEFLWTIAVARLVLPSDIHLQAPPNLSDDLGPADRFGDR